MVRPEQTPPSEEKLIMTKDKMAKALSDFCKKHKVETMDLVTYKSHGNDVPVKDYLLRRAFGSWNRVLSAMKKTTSSRSSCSSTCSSS